VGKSSIVNSILKEDKTIVSDQEHTTRDIQLLPFKYNNSDFMLIDTAGIRKKRTQIKKDELEFKSVQQTEKAIKETDIVILVTDVSENLSVSDLKFAKLIQSAQKGLIILANKWDLIEDKDLKTYNEYLKYYKITMPYLMWAKVIPISAAKNIRLTKILDEAIIIHKKFKQEISKEDLHKFLQEILRIHKPTIGRGAMKPKIKEIKQVSTSPQTFEVIIGARMSLNNSYLKFINKKIREKFSLQGVPVIAYVRKLKHIT
jgi:GTP-binding protein